MWICDVDNFGSVYNVHPQYNPQLCFYCGNKLNSVAHRINHNQCSSAGYSLVATVELLLAYDRLRDANFTEESSAFRKKTQWYCPQFLPHVNPTLVETLDSDVESIF